MFPFEYSLSTEELAQAGESIYFYEGWPLSFNNTVKRRVFLKTCIKALCVKVGSCCYDWGNGEMIWKSGRTKTGQVICTDPLTVTETIEWWIDVMMKWTNGFVCE